MSDLEPRVRNLEEVNATNAKTLQAVQRDVHHISETFKKMEQTFEKLIQVTYQIDTVKDIGIRAHKRLDEIEIRMKQDNERFHACRSTKLDKADLAEFNERLEVITKDITEIRVAAASHSWVAKIVWALASGLIVAGFSYMQMKGD